MSQHQHLALRWQLALGFTLLAGIFALAIGLYVANARQHVGTNYTALVADVVRAQQQPVLLRHTLESLDERHREVHEARLNNLLWRIPQHIGGVTYGLERSQLDPAEYRPALDRLQSVEARLPELQQQVDEMQAGHSPDELARIGFAIENDLSRAYSELNELIHTAAGEQRIIMERLTLAITLLVLLSLLVVGALMLALLRLSHHRVAMARLSQLDELTGLGNRRHLQEAAEMLHQQSRRNGQPLSMALLDLDHFKRLNDTYGHPAGDQVLMTFAKALKGATRQADIVARMGGEEFCVLMPDTPDSGALELADRIRQRIATLPQQELGIPTAITVSLGLATGYGDSANFDSLYSRADRALYLAKANGRNSIEVG